MVAKGPSVAFAKMRRFAERKDRSLCVMMKKRVDMDKAVMEELVKGVHSGIERVFFPRQRVPRFFFVLCKEDDAKDAVSKAIRTVNIAELGPLLPKKVQNKEFKLNEPVKLTGTKNVDPLTLVLEAIPKTLETETIKKEFPSCKDIVRFNAGRCYVSFKDIPDAYEALKKVKSGPLCGFKIIAKFNKIQKPKNLVIKDKVQQQQEKQSSPKKNVKHIKKIK